MIHRTTAFVAALGLALGLSLAYTGPIEAG